MPSDAAQMAHVHAAAFANDAPWTGAAIGAMLERPEIRALGIWDGAQLVAFILIQCVDNTSEILTLATHPDHRRQGFARALILDLERQPEASGLLNWWLDVAADNSGAIAFYQALGFRIDGRRPKYYARLEGRRVDAILMSKARAGQTVK
ncbi:MAG: GNAT family N-acetyltransferase [Pseudomonadota bacterium]